MGEWRVGRHYSIHVYDDDVPVATFFTATDAAQAVRDHNRLQAVLDLTDPAQYDLTKLSAPQLASHIRTALGE